MKKLIALSLMAAVAAWTLGPAFVGATIVTDGDSVSTGLTPDTSGGLRPIVKAKWEMKGPCFTTGTTPSYNQCVTSEGGEEGADDSTAAGAQFNAPGVWDANMDYTVCAIATDPNGIGDIDGVYADIYFPTNRKMHVSMDPDEIDDPTGSCGAFIEENTLRKLSKDDGIDLFCSQIRLGNPNLPVFASPYSYDEICNPETGELVEEEAYVYCDDKAISWEHPAGDYKVEVTAHDAYGPGAALTNTFKYVEFTGFQVDFNSLTYLNVAKDVRNQISGDRVFDAGGASAMPTVRNIGNTMLNVQVAQDDMLFGQSSGVWNVKYDARVGNVATDWSGYYNPFKEAGVAGDPTSYRSLKEILNLSETEKMDFVILVSKWSRGTTPTTPYAGNMWLEASKASFVTPCVSG